MSDASPKQTPRSMAPVRRARQIEFSVPNEPDVTHDKNGGEVRCDENANGDQMAHSHKGGESKA